MNPVVTLPVGKEKTMLVYDNGLVGLNYSTFVAVKDHQILLSVNDMKLFAMLMDLCANVVKEETKEPIQLMYIKKRPLIGHVGYITYPAPNNQAHFRILYDPYHHNELRTALIDRDQLVDFDPTSLPCREAVGLIPEPQAVAF